MARPSKWPKRLNFKVDQMAYDKIIQLAEDYHLTVAELLRQMVEQVSADTFRIKRKKPRQMTHANGTSHV